jgi:hypothetical protein
MAEWTLTRNDYEALTLELCRSSEHARGWGECYEYACTAMYFFKKEMQKAAERGDTLPLPVSERQSSNDA